MTLLLRLCTFNKIYLNALLKNSENVFIIVFFTTFRSKTTQPVISISFSLRIKKFPNVIDFVKTVLEHIA